MDTSKIEHLKMIQGIIARMAGNSGSMKRWMIALVPFVAAFAKFGNAPLVAGISGIIPLACMCWQDSRYLRLERAYRKMHKAIVAGENVTLFDLNPKPYLNRVDSFIRTLFSWSILSFYLPLLVALVIALWASAHCTAIDIGI